MKKFKNKKDKSTYKVFTRSIIEMFERDKNFVEIKENKPSNNFESKESNKNNQSNVD